MDFSQIQVNILKFLRIMQLIHSITTFLTILHDKLQQNIEIILVLTLLKVISNIMQISSLVKSIKTLFSKKFKNQKQIELFSKKFKKLETNRAVQDTDVPVQILNKNDNFSAEQICLQFNYAISASKFPASFKFTNITPVYKNSSKNQKDDYRPKAFSQMLARYLKFDLRTTFKSF